MPQAAIGSYAKGCMAGGAMLAAEGPRWQAVRLSRNRNWGHPVMIGFLEDFAGKLPGIQRLARAAGGRHLAAARRADADGPAIRSCQASGSTWTWAGPCGRALLRRNRRSGTRPPERGRLRSVALFEPATVGLFPPDEAGPEGPAAASGPGGGPGTRWTGSFGRVRQRRSRGARRAGAGSAGRRTRPRRGVLRGGASRPWPGGRSARPTPHGGRPGAEPARQPQRPRFAEGAALLEAWFPAADHRMLDANHFLMAQAPDATAELLDRFWQSAP